jgi:hypothetical protein
MTELRAGGEGRDLCPGETERMSAFVAAGLVMSLIVAVDAPAPGTFAATPATLVTPTTKPLHEIAHVKALTPFCSAFEKHFNGAARPLITSDATIGYVGYTFGGIESHFHARGGELAIYDDRVHLMAYVGSLQKLIPQAQSEVDALRESAKLADDPGDATATKQLASELQAALDKQRQIAIDSLGVVQALTDYSISPTRLGFEDLGEQLGSGGRAVALLSRPDPMGFLGGLADNAAPRASTELQSQVPGGYDDATVRTPPERRDVRSYLKWQNQLDRIGDAEGTAALAADALSERCR